LRPFFVFAVLSLEREALSEILSATEGLENRMIEGIRRGETMAEIIRYTKSKRYTETRVKRLMIHTLLGLGKGDMTQIYGGDIYGRVLAFSAAGAELLRYIKKNDLAAFPLMTNMNKQREPETESADLKKLIEFDLKASDLYRLAQRGEIKGFIDSKCNPETKDES
jgi:predicted nucleotidyltransferase